MAEEDIVPAGPPQAPARDDRNGAPSLRSRTRSVVGWIRDHWKLLTAAYVFLLFFWPAFYLANVNAVFPKAYYKMGSLIAPDFSKSANWNVDLAAYDNRPHALRLEGLLASVGQIARIEKDNYIPGRSTVGALSDESAGKSWGGGQCLFIKDVTFVVMVPVKLDAPTDGGSGTDFVALGLYRPNDPSVRYMNVAASTLVAEAKAQNAAPGAYFRTILKSMGLDKFTVPTQDGGTVSARLQAWAYGAPAPCSIWPF